MSNVLRYLTGEEINAGDILAPGESEDDQISRVVIVFPIGETVPGYEINDWPHLTDGILVEQRNAGGVHLVHYFEIDKDIELLHRG